MDKPVSTGNIQLRDAIETDLPIFYEQQLNPEATRQVAGNIVSFEQSGKREVGSRLGNDFWGKGIATRALTAFLKRVTSTPLVRLCRKTQPCIPAGTGKMRFNLDGEEGEELILKLGA